ncbi:hypothetical protein BGX27_000491 [Mortierella sp. AM989]|nr:hypothetical protein BGX27_000491 [Mortierella sp. AM989]
MSTSYGATNAAPATAHHDDESQALLNGHSTNTEANDTFYGRGFVHVTTHRKRYFAAWLFAAVVAISTVLGIHYYHKLHDGHHHGSNGDKTKDLMSTKPAVCDSDRSYPIAILLSIFFGYVG